VLELVDQDRGWTRHEQRQVLGDQLPGRRVVEVDDVHAVIARQPLQQGALADRPRACEHDDWLVQHELSHHWLQPAGLD